MFSRFEFCFEGFSFVLEVLVLFWRFEFCFEGCSVKGGSVALKLAGREKAKCMNTIKFMKVFVLCTDRVPRVTATINTALRCIGSGAAIRGSMLRRHSMGTKSSTKIFKFRWFTDPSGQNQLILVT